MSEYYSPKQTKNSSDPKSGEPFEKLKKVTDEIYSGLRSEYSADVVNILLDYNIKLRNKDGEPCQMNISIPSTRSNSILVGIRYSKIDGTNTEDHFLFEKGKSIVSFYKGKIEKILPEYKGTHKAQINSFKKEQ